MEGGGIEGGHGLDEMAGILGTGGLEAGVHGQLGKADVHRVHRDVGVGDEAQRAAAGEGDMLLPYTVDVMKIMTALRREWGVVYPEEQG